ncbi:MAG: hypothetical protein WD009_08920 [Phycisphaeraceae bacterium]
MQRTLEELHHEQTALGELILRRRRSVAMPGTIVYEVKLNGEFLMSSLVRQAEEALATHTLRRGGGTDRAVLIGGLGLGHTAEAALREPDVASVEVVEYLAPVIDWHQRRLVPASAALMDDPRCRLIHDDFFKRVAEAPASDADRYDAILVDIDHAPESLLDAGHAGFYGREGLERMARHLRSGGVFGLWSADRPGEVFLDAARGAFAAVEVEPVRYVNPNLAEPETNWLVIARGGVSA